MTKCNESQRRIICTGGMGYIGSHTVLKLIEVGFEPVIIDNLCNSTAEVLNRIKKISGKSVEFHQVDIRDGDALEKIFSSSHFECIIHFAALKAVGESVQKPLMYYGNNISGTVVLLEAMKKAGLNRIVFSSSATVYQPSEVPLAETAALGCTNPYGQTKRMMEQILEDVCVADQAWKVEVLRYFNPVGAHESGLIGEAPQGFPNNLMPYIQQVGVGRRSHLNVFGNDYDTKDGTGIRDYIHVQDLAEAHVMAVEYLSREDVSGCNVHNLGTGNGSSVLEMVKGFEEASGKPIPFQIAPRRPGDLATVICDPSKVKKDMGWEAKYGMKEMMEHAWKWQSLNPYGFESEQNQP